MKKTVMAAAAILLITALIANLPTEIEVLSLEGTTPQISFPQITVGNFTFQLENFTATFTTQNQTTYVEITYAYIDIQTWKDGNITVSDVYVEAHQCKVQGQFNLTLDYLKLKMTVRAKSSETSFNAQGTTVMPLWMVALKK